MQLELVLAYRLSVIYDLFLISCTEDVFCLIREFAVIIAVKEYRPYTASDLVTVERIGIIGKLYGSCTLTVSACDLEFLCEISYRSDILNNFEVICIFERLTALVLTAEIT